MAAPTAADVAAFVGKPADAATLALAESALPVVTAMAKSYTRDNGFVDDEPVEDVAAVLITATARMIANPAQIDSETMGPFAVTYQPAFAGWSLFELYALNRYRVNAL